MEFVPLRSLQRGLPEVWQTLSQENGRIVLTNKGQPAYLLVDLADQNVVSLINWLDYYRSRSKAAFDHQVLTPEQKAAAQRFLSAVQSINKDSLTADEEAALAELESGKYKANIYRELDL
jgi:hypothetical protein